MCQAVFATHRGLASGVEFDQPMALLLAFAEGG